jgi:hypothetical protein
MLGLETDSSLVKLTPCRIKIRSIGAESNVPHGKRISSRRRLRLCTFDREKCDRGSRNPDYGRVIALYLLVAPLKSEDIAIPSHGALNVSDGNGDMVNSL